MRELTQSRFRAIAVAAMGLSLLAILQAPTSASAQEPRLLWQKCEAGQGAGQCSASNGVAIDPATGNLYVAEKGNSRISEFSPWGQLLTAWGWGVANGAPEPQSCGPEATPPTATCRQGLKGVGAGQLSVPRGVAVDSEGDLYVYETQECTGGVSCEVQPNRVQKFDSEGDFVLMLGREVNQTKVGQREAQEANAEPVTVSAQEENVCTAASGDVCGIGAPGAGPGEFGAGPLPIDPIGGKYIAVGPADTLYVGGQERIQEFDAEGNYLKSISIPGESVVSLAVDFAGNSYVVYASDDPFGVDGYEAGAIRPEVTKLGPAGQALCVAGVDSPRVLATDLDGELYVVDGGGPDDVMVRKFGASCQEDPDFAFEVSGVTFPSSNFGIATSSACGIDGAALYFSNSTSPELARAYYPAPDPTVCPPPAVAPRIEDQYAVSVAAKSAVLRARINPRFWPDATYYVQYGAEDCKENPTGCEQVKLFPGAALAAHDDAAVDTAGVLLTDLEPDTTYHYRFVAQSGGGGPVFGDGAEEGGSFRTYPLPLPTFSDCPNQARRYGPSANLPDCRAFEMVSPVDKEGGDVNVPAELIHTRARYLQSSLDGSRFTYSSWKSFGGQPSSLFTNQYLASRGADGWSSQGINPPQDTRVTLPSALLATSFQAFTPDLSSGWTMSASGVPLSADGLEGYVNLYRRDNLEGSFEALTNAGPFAPTTSVLDENGNPSEAVRIQGYSTDLAHQVFATRAALTPDAATNGQHQVYELVDGALRLVSVLPGGGASTVASAVGKGDYQRRANHERAVSRDGARIYWSAGGKIYVRVDGAETVPVSQSVGNQAARYWSASTDGAQALFEFTEGLRDEDLYRFDLEAEDSTLIARQVIGVLGSSEDLSHVYFLSRAALAAGATAGQNNLYLDHEGAKTLIAALSPADIGQGPTVLTAYDFASSSPLFRPSRVTPDGRHIAFNSTASLTGHDNLDANSAKPDAQVYIYGAEDERLRCVSCKPSGARPTGRELLEPQADPAYGGKTGVWGAAWIPGSEWELNQSRPLSADGERLFFNSYDSLLLRDTNNRMDVYEWEAGESQAQCEALGADLFLATEGGCLSLISTGDSSEDSEFADATPSGDDVFFKTTSGLDPDDPGLADLYDARVGGGFARPAPAGPCVGDACQGAAPAPVDAPLASAGFRGAGDRKRAPKSRCAKGKRRVARRGKARCVGGKRNSRRHKRQKRASADRRAQR